MARIRADLRFFLFGLSRSRRDSRYEDVEEDSGGTGMMCPVMMKCPVPTEDTENIQQYHGVPESAPPEEVQTKPATSDVLTIQRTHFEKWVDEMKELVEEMHDGCVQMARGHLMDNRRSELNSKHVELLEELSDL